MTDPIWWFYIFWLPKYLIEARHFSVENLRLFGFIPFLAAVPGSVAGGWLSGHLLRQGRSVNFSRKTALLICALCMPIAMIAVFSPSPWMALVPKANSVWMVVALVGLAAAAHQGWSANVFTLASDMFPKAAVASVVGFGGMIGSGAGVLFQLLAGRVSYVLLYAIAGTVYPLAVLMVHLLTPKLKPAKLD